MASGGASRSALGREGPWPAQTAAESRWLAPFTARAGGGLRTLRYLHSGGCAIAALTVGLPLADRYLARRRCFAPSRAVGYLDWALDLQGAIYSGGGIIRMVADWLCSPMPLRCSGVCTNCAPSDAYRAPVTGCSQIRMLPSPHFAVLAVPAASRPFAAFALFFLCFPPPPTRDAVVMLLCGVGLCAVYGVV